MEEGREFIARTEHFKKKTELSGMDWIINVLT
jgi:hypothetical protein